MLNYNRVAAASLALAALAVLGSGCSSVSPDGKEWAPTPAEGAGEKIGQTAQALTGANKICSVIVSGNWRDTMVVPNNWTAGTCQFWRDTIGGQFFQIGCVFDPGVSLSGLNSSLPPANNCGWQ